MKLPIGEFLAQIRKERGYTQREVAEKLGISNRTLSAWEQGRAYPDVLTLAQLAQVYGVTADEILKGEKNAPAEPSQQPATEEDAEPRSSAHSTGSTAENTADCVEEQSEYTAKDCRDVADKFSLRSKILAAVHCCGALILCMGFVSAVYILWLGILLIILGVCAVVVSCGLLAAFSDGALKAIGVRPHTDNKVLTPDQNRYALSIGKSNAVAMLVCGAVWCVFALVIKILLHGVLGLIITLLPLSFGLLMIIFAAIGSSSDIKKYGSIGQRSVHSGNVKLLKKCLAFTAIPVALAIGLVIFFAVWRQTEVFVDYRGQRDGMVSYMHTAVISDGNWEGEYALDLSGVTTVGKNYERVHENFYAILNDDGSIDLFTEEPGKYFCTVYPIEVKDSATKVYNVRYGCGAVEFTNVERNIEIKQVDGEYNVVRTEITDRTYDGVAYGIAVCLCSFAVCAIVYFVKRKRIENKE